MVVVVHRGGGWARELSDGRVLQRCWRYRAGVPCSAVTAATGRVDAISWGWVPLMGSRGH